MDDVSEIKALIWEYKRYKSLAGCFGGHITTHSQYEHLQSAIKMCDDKLVELHNQLKEAQRHNREEN